MATSIAAIRHERKEKMIAKTKEYFNTYKNYMLLNIYRVQSTQFKDIMGQLPSNVKSLFAKKKILKKILTEIDPVRFKNLLDSCKGSSILLFFDNADPKKILEVTEGNKRSALAAAGDVPTKNIVLPAGPTGMAPEKINLFQNARIMTKINKGKIDIVNDHVLVPAGQPVGISDANLLTLLNILPFEFGLDIMKVFENGEVYGKNILLVDESCIEDVFKSAIASIAAVSLGTDTLTEAALPFVLSSAYSDAKKISLGLDFSI